MVGIPTLKPFAAALAKKHGISEKAAGEFLLQFTERIAAHAKSGAHVRVENLGVFWMRRYANNPVVDATGVRHEFPVRERLVFRPAKPLARHFKQESA